MYKLICLTLIAGVFSQKQNEVAVSYYDDESYQKHLKEALKAKKVKN